MTKNELYIAKGELYEDELGRQVRVTWVGTNGMITFNRLHSTWEKKATLHRRTFEKVYKLVKEKNNG